MRKYRKTVGQARRREMEQDLGPRYGRASRRDEHPSPAEAKTCPSDYGLSLGVLDIESDRRSRIEPLYGLRHPLAYLGCLDRFLESHSVGEPGSQDGRRALAKPDDVSAQGISLSNLDQQRSTDRDRFRQEDCESAGTNGPRSAGKWFERGMLGTQRGVPNGQVAGKAQVATHE